MRKFLVFTCVIMLIYITSFSYFISYTIPKQNKDIDNSDNLIVVLTGDSKRINQGLELLIAGKGKKILISGVNKNTNLADIKYYSSELQHKHIQVLENKILLGYNAKTTRGNAIETKKYLEKAEFKNIIIVTSDYHMPRSFLEFNLALPDINIIKNSVFNNKLLNKYWLKSYYKIFMEYNKYLIVKFNQIVR